MPSRVALSLALILSLDLNLVHGQNMTREPYIGFAYPGGGQQGTTFEVSLGGQFLHEVDSVQVSGTGVHGKIIRHLKPLRPQNMKAVVQEAKRRLIEEQESHLPPEGLLERARTSVANFLGRIRTPESEDEMVDPEMRFHPVIQKLETLDPAELQYMVKDFRSREKQPNRQIDETMVISVVIDPDATPGEREVRLLSNLGLTNPLRFMVGRLPEILEDEPNNPDWSELPRVRPPLVLNGQITPGDIDCFRFEARKGQQLVFEAHARRLIPYLADAVPGWFQATLTLRNGSGREIGFADDNGIHPDPILLCTVPADGEYRLDVRDALFRGRKDFVYRVSIHDQPVTPAQPGDPTPVTHLDHWASLSTGPEIEPNDSAGVAQKISFPWIVDGCISRPGDEDRFAFDGLAGQQVVIEVSARREGSELDSLVRLQDPQGALLDWNDDHKSQNVGLVTHNADSSLTAKLPTTGIYTIRLTDAQQHGSAQHTYRMRVSPPLPDFTAFATPSGLNLMPGPATPLTLHVIRRDGFTGPIHVDLENPPPGFSICGSVIPENMDKIRMTITAPPGVLDPPIPLSLVARASAEETAPGDASVVLKSWEIRHAVVPAEDSMQAFLWRHLVPASQFLVANRQPRPRRPTAIRLGEDMVNIRRGQATAIRFRVPQHPMLNEIRFELSDPPEGMTLDRIDRSPGEVSIVILAAANAPEAGYRDNLIVELKLERRPEGAANKPESRQGQPKPNNRNGSATALKTRPAPSAVKLIPVGSLPAIPFQIVP